MYRHHDRGGTLPAVVVLDLDRHRIDTNLVILMIKLESFAGDRERLGA